MTLVSDSLRDQNGRPVVGAVVTIRDAAGVAVATLTTNGAGAWSTDLDGGTYSVVAVAPNGFIVRTIVVCEDDPNGNVIGRTVIDQRGLPVAAAQVWIRDEAGALVDVDGGNPRFTDHAGHWDADLAFGTYALHIVKGDASIDRELMVCPVSFYILSELGERISSEADERLVWEPSP